jgi:hypothetical protein
VGAYVSSIDRLSDEVLAVPTLLPACVVTVPAQNMHALAAGAKRLLLVLSYVLAPQERFEFRRLVSRLEAYRRRTGEAHAAALTASLRTKQPMAWQLDLARALRTHPRTRTTMERLLPAFAPSGSATLISTLSPAAVMAHWRAVDMLESDEAEALLASARDVVPTAHRAGIYTLLSHYLGVLRVSDVDATLFAVGAAGSAPAAGTATGASAATGAVVSGAAASTAPASDAGAAGASVTGSTTAGAPDGSAGAQPPASTSEDAMALARRLCRMLNYKDLGRLRHVLSGHWELEDQITRARMRIRRRLETEEAALRAAATAAASASGASSAAASAVASGTGTPDAATGGDAAPAASAVAPAADSAAVPPQPAASEPTSAVTAATAAPADGGRTIEGDPSGSGNGAPGGEMSSLLKRITDLGERVRHLCSTLAASPPTAEQAPAAYFSLEKLRREAVARTLSRAERIFGPLAFTLDAPFARQLKAGRLRPGLLDGARRETLLEDARNALNEEVLIDQSARALPAGSAARGAAAEADAAEGTGAEGARSSEHGPTVAGEAGGLAEADRETLRRIVSEDQEITVQHAEARHTGSGAGGGDARAGVDGLQRGAADRELLREFDASRRRKLLQVLTMRKPSPPPSPLPHAAGIEPAAAQQPSGAASDATRDAAAAAAAATPAAANPAPAEGSAAADAALHQDLRQLGAVLTAATGPSTDAGTAAASLAAASGIRMPRLLGPWASASLLAPDAGAAAASPAASNAPKAGGDSRSLLPEELTSALEPLVQLGGDVPYTTQYTAGAITMPLRLTAVPLRARAPRSSDSAAAAAPAGATETASAELTAASGDDSSQSTTAVDTEGRPTEAAFHATLAARSGIAITDIAVKPLPLLRGVVGLTEPASPLPQASCSLVTVSAPWNNWKATLGPSAAHAGESGDSPTPAAAGAAAAGAPHSASPGAAAATEVQTKPASGAAAPVLSERELQEQLSRWNTPEGVRRKIFVSRLPLEATPADVAAAFCRLGRVQRVEMWTERADTLRRRLAEEARLALLREKSNVRRGDSQRSKLKRPPVAPGAPAPGGAGDDAAAADAGGSAAAAGAGGGAGNSGANVASSASLAGPPPTAGGLRVGAGQGQTRALHSAAAAAGAAGPSTLSTLPCAVPSAWSLCARPWWQQRSLVSRALATSPSRLLCGAGCAASLGTKSGPGGHQRFDAGAAASPAAGGSASRGSPSPPQRRADGSSQQHAAAGKRTHRGRPLGATKGSPKQPAAISKQPFAAASPTSEAAGQRKRGRPRDAATLEETVAAITQDRAGRASQAIKQAGAAASPAAGAKAAGAGAGQARASPSPHPPSHASAPKPQPHARSSGPYSHTSGSGGPSGGRLPLPPGKAAAGSAAGSPAPADARAPKPSKATKAAGGKGASASGSAAAAAGGPRSPLEGLPMAARSKLFKTLDERRRSFNVHSPLVAFVYFEDEAGAAASSSEDLRLFGMVLRNQACRVQHAQEQRVLYIGGLPSALTPEATQELFDSLLAAAGLQVQLPDRGRLRQGIVGTGEVFVEFPCHEDAVRAAYCLRGAELVMGKPVVVGWAAADEWRQARPRMPVYF